VLKFKDDLVKGRPNSDPDAPSVGGPADHYFVWTAKAKGTTTLRIKLFPPGVNTKPSKSYKLTVRVK